MYSSVVAKKSITPSKHGFEVDLRRRQSTHKSPNRRPSLSYSYYLKKKSVKPGSSYSEVEGPSDRCHEEIALSRSRYSTGTYTFVSQEPGPRIRLNITGKIFEVQEDLLDRYPKGLLGSSQKRRAFYDASRDEYFFDRNREAFEGILFFYQSNGRFEIPSFIHDEVFYEEVKYFGLLDYFNCDSTSNDAFTEYIYTRLREELNRKLDETDDLNEIRTEQEKFRRRFYRFSNLFSEEEDEDRLVKLNVSKPWRKKLWLILERPNNSFLGRIVTTICLLAVVVSVVAMCHETIIESGNKVQNRQISKFSHESNSRRINSRSLPAEKPAQITREDILFERRFEYFVIELVCNIIFTLELILRIIATPDLLKFFKNFSNIIDIVAIVPFWTAIVVNSAFVAGVKTSETALSLLEQTQRAIEGNLTTRSHSSRVQATLSPFRTTANMLSSTTTTPKPSANNYGLSVLRLLRLTRILRVLKLSRHIRALNMLGRILFECAYEIILLVSFLCMNIMIFSTLIYFIELDALGKMSPFLSIPHSFWWAVISFTTVGYGDLIPASNVGKLFGGFFIICGILIALLPVPILSSKFERIYNEICECSRNKKNRAKNEESKKENSQNSH